MGCDRGAAQVVVVYKSVLTGHAQVIFISHIRASIGEKTALGLDLFLAGDIIQTIMAPSWQSLAILGGIVVIRTVIAFFLNEYLRELAEK